MRVNSTNRLWQEFWDFVFTVSNIVLAVLFGTALGNVVRGVPLDSSGEFHMAFFTDFRVRGHVGLLDWYTVTLGIFTLVMLSAHGATYLTLKTEGTVHDRSQWLAGILWVTVCAGLVVISIETWFVRSEPFGNMLHRPIAWLAVGGAAIFTGIRSRMEFRAFAGSPARPACRSGYSADNSLFEMLCWMSVGIFPIIRGIDESTTFDVQGSLFESLWIDRSRSV